MTRKKVNIFPLSRFSIYKRESNSNSKKFITFANALKNGVLFLFEFVGVFSLENIQSDKTTPFSFFFTRIFK